MVYVSAFFNEEAFNQEGEHRLEDRLIQYLWQNVEERDWVYDLHEDLRHWFIFKPELLDQVATPNEADLATFMNELKETQFKSYARCCNCGLVVFNYMGMTYRDNCGCVGRVFECCHCQGLNSAAAYKLFNTRKVFGTGGAVLQLINDYLTPVDLNITADNSIVLEPLERALLDEVLKHDPAVLTATTIHFHASLLEKMKIEDKELSHFRNQLLKTKFRAYPLCTTCDQVLFGYNGVVDHKHLLHHQCLDCETLSDHERDMVMQVRGETGLCGREAHQEAQARIEAARTVEVLADWTPVSVDGYQSGCFIVENNLGLEAGMIIDGNVTDLKYCVVLGDSVAEAKYHVGLGNQDNWVSWNELQAYDGFVQPDESFVMPTPAPEVIVTDATDDADLPF